MPKFSEAIHNLFTFLPPTPPESTATSKVPSHAAFMHRNNFMEMECHAPGEGLTTAAIGSASTVSMEVAENLHSGATVIEDVDIYDATEEESITTDICQRLHKMISDDSSNFDSWTVIVDEVERSCKENMDTICLAYDSLLSKFPLCHWYWRRYAYEIIRLSDPNKAVEIFDRALSIGMYSLGLWLDYCLFGMSFFEDKDVGRRLFKTAILFVGKDYYCHALWDQYIKFEYSQQNWSSLANIYLEVLRHPTNKLREYYDNFKKFVVGMEEETTHEKTCEIELEGVLSNDVTLLSKSEISRVIEDLQSPDDEDVRSKAICKYKFIGNQLYEKARVLDEKIKYFEENIERQYFDITPLGDEQLRNWHCYLDFMEKQGDFSWALQVFERCLISCANYPEFWIRYVEFMESKGGRELANFALERATKIFLKDLPEIHLFSFRFKERIGDTKAARAAVIHLDMGSDFYLTRHVIELANMERRSGNFKAAYDIYDKAIKIAEEKKHWRSLSGLFIHLSRLKYMITGTVDGTRDILIDGIQRVPHCRALLEELIKFVMTHQGPSQVNLLDSIVARAISPSTDGSQSLDSKDQEDISSLFLEFVDLCGTVDEIRKARSRHIQLFPQFLRSNFVCKITNSNHFLNENLEQGQDPSSALLLSQFEEKKSKIEHIEEDQVHLLPVNNDCNPDLVSACLSAQKYDTEQNLSNQVAVESTAAATAMKEADPNLVNQLIEPTPTLAGSTQSLAEQRQDKPGTPEIPPTSVHDSSADKSSPNALPCDLNCQSIPTTPVGLSQEQSSSASKQDQEFEHHLEPYSENHSSNSQQKVFESNPVASGEQNAILENTKIYRNAPEDCLKANTVSPAAGPNHTPNADSSQVQEHSEEVPSDILLSPTSHQMHKPIEMATYTGGEYHKRKQRDIIPEGGGSSEDLLHSEDQKWSPQDLTVAGSEMLVTQRHPLPSAAKMRGTGQVHQEACAVQKNMSSNHVTPINPVSDQSSFHTNQQCTSSPLVSSHQPNLTPTGIQSSHQSTSQNPSQNMNQIWQLGHHQHQHLLQQQYQQQQLQMVQQQQQDQQSYQFQQQHDPQQACSSQQQPQVSPGPYQVNQQQPPHLQHVQHQPQQLYYQQQQFLQQLYQQAEKLTYQMHQQGYAKETAQAYAYQVLWQQYQLHQQGYAQMSHQEQYNQQLHVYNQMVLQQQQQSQLLQQHQNDQHTHLHESRGPEPDLLKGQIQNLQGIENLKEGSNSSREKTPESAYRRPQH